MAKSREKHPSGAKAQQILLALSARLNSLVKNGERLANCVSDVWQWLKPALILERLRPG